MNQVKFDRLSKSILRLRRALATEGLSNVDRWGSVVHSALGELADAIQYDVAGAEETLANIGEINPDYQHAPVTERHVELTHNKLIQLGEKIHELRAEIRQGSPTYPLDMIQLRLRGEEIADAVAKVRQADGKFLLDTFNSNPGAGE